MTWWSGPAAELHALDLPGDGRRHVWVLEPVRPALVLGSTQAEGVADAGALAARGIDLARRRSGGGAVLVDPADTLWVDVVVPRGDALWCDDVGASFAWLGEAWQRALAAVGVVGEVHAGPLVRGPFGALVCFAGVGSGEVLVGGRKVVGLSQRRTRTAARFQSVAYTAGSAVGRIAELLVPPEGVGRAALAAGVARVTAPVPVDAGELLAALLAALPGRV